MSLGPYTVGDVPATPIEIDIVGLQDPNAYDVINVTILKPSGDAMSDPDLTLTGLISQDSVDFLFPSAFDVAGVWNVQMVLAGAGRVGNYTLPLVPFVVQSATSDGWHSLNSIRAAWGQAPLDDIVLFNLLDIAKLQVAAYAPTLGESDPVPSNYKYAQGMQARNLLNANQVSPSGQIGDGSDFTITPFPLDWTVKAILRPPQVARLG